MEIEFVLACDNAIVDTENKVSIIGIFSEIRAASFPALHPELFIVVGIRGVAKDYPITIIIKNDDEVVIEGGGLVHIAEDGKAAIYLSKFIGNVFKKEDEYEIVAKVGNKTRSLPLQLIQD